MLLVEKWLFWNKSLWASSPWGFKPKVPSSLVAQEKHSLKMPEVLGLLARGNDDMNRSLDWGWIHSLAGQLRFQAQQGLLILRLNTKEVPRARIIWIKGSVGVFAELMTYVHATKLWNTAIKNWEAKIGKVEWYGNPARPWAKQCLETDGIKD